MNLTLFAANALLNGTPMPATLYMQLHTGDPGVACTNNLSTAVRKSFGRTASSVAQSVPSSPIQWNPIGVAETITHCSIWDALSGGNPWWAGEHDTTEATVPADLAQFNLVLTLQYWGET